MPKAIYKYPLEVAVIQSIQMPAGSEIISVQIQDVYPKARACLWAIVDLNAAMVKRIIRGYVTGKIPENDCQPSGDKHMATVLFEEGAFVFHYFDCGEVPVNRNTDGMPNA